MPSITFLGTGPGTVTPGRGQSSLLLQSGEADVLLDAGEPCAKGLLDLGFDPAVLAAVLITHGHADHVGGLPLLLQSIASRQGARSLRLGLPGHLVAPVEGWLRATFLAVDELGFPLTIFPWQAGVAVQIKDVTVVPRLTTHLARRAEAGVESFLFDITIGGKRIVYSGDLGAPSDLRSVLDAPADLLICELAHFSIGDLVAILKPARIGALCLTHLSDEAAGRRAEIDLYCARELDQVQDVYLPDDGERIEL